MSAVELAVAERTETATPGATQAGRSTARLRVAVVGIGNVLLGDDGVGPYALRAVEAGLEIPDDVTLLDLGTPGPELAHYLIDWDVMVVLDAVRADAPPGTVKLYRRDDILRRPPPARMSPPDPSLRDALLTAEFAGLGPKDVVLVGVVPANLSRGTRLSAVVRSAIPAVVALVAAELDRLGVEVRRREDEREPSTSFWDG